MAVIKDGTQAKSFLKSKTILGVLAAGLGFMGQRFWGVELNDSIANEAAAQVADGLFMLLEGGGLLLAGFGRLKAKQPLDLPGKGGTAAFICAYLLFFPEKARATQAFWQADLFTISLGPMALNLAYALIAFILIALLWFCVLDKLMLRGFSTSRAIKQGNLAAACFAGLGFLGLAVMIGLVVG
jgi:hypothetical protein